jgi:hypothetical protein
MSFCGFSEELKADIEKLRPQLPMICQTGRLIFPWNPLRRNTLFRKPSSILRALEPKASRHFALGSRY